MNKSLVRKGIVIGIIVLFIGASVVPNVCGNSGVISVKDKEMVFGNVFTRGAPEVWVDDDYYDGGYNDGHTWGYDAFDNIQDGVDNVLEDGRVNVKDGLYDVFQVEGRTNLIIIGEGQPIVTGNQLVYDTSYPEYVNNVVFVNNSQYIYLVGFEILGTNPTSPVRDFSVFYQNSHGAMRNCSINANSIDNMNALAIRVIAYSSLTVENCTLMNYGRIGIYAKTGTTLNVLNCTLIGQTYTVYNQVNYGIELEGIDEPCDGIIKGNEIYNHDNTQVAAWSSAGIIVDYWRYYGPQYNCKNSTVLIENNDIYENMHGVQIVPNENIEIIYNEIHDNNYGAISEPWFDGSTYHNVDLNAILNWWGDPTGPYHPTENPDGLGDEIFGDVLFDPWTADITADILCDGLLNWENVAPGGTVEGSFTIGNDGYIYSELSWEVDDKPTWGVWTINPESGTGLTHGMGQITVQVSIIAPLNKNKEFTGKLKIINSDDPSDYCEIDVYLKTPRNKPFNMNLLFLRFLENHPHMFPILRTLLGL